MRHFLIFATFFFSANVYALDSVIKFSTKELNKNELIASSGTEIATAMRVIQLQLRASGCLRPIIVSPDMFEKRSDYTFNVDSDNCVVVPNSSKCETGYSSRNMKANPNSNSDAIVGIDKYIVCLKSSADQTPAGTKKSNGVK